MCFPQVPGDHTVSADRRQEGVPLLWWAGVQGQLLREDHAPQRMDVPFQHEYYEHCSCQVIKLKEKVTIGSKVQYDAYGDGVAYTDPAGVWGRSNPPPPTDWKFGNLFVHPSVCVWMPKNCWTFSGKIGPTAKHFGSSPYKIFLDPSPG